MVVGGGPAGMAAALAAARAGLPCTLIDEAPGLGGQIYRQSPEPFTRARAGVPEKDFLRGQRLRRALADQAEGVEVRLETAVLGIWNGRELLWRTGERTGMLRAERLILAPGAYDRPVPFPGWTLPGVMTAGGAQLLVKTMGVRPGRRALVAGTGPLLLVVANQLHQAGVEVAAVLEAGRPRFTLGAVRRVWREWGLLRDAWDYWRGLRRAGIPVRFNQTIFAARGEGEVAGATLGPVDPEDWRPRRERAETVEVDLIVAGFGFVPNTELTVLAGCRHAYREAVGGWVPVRDAHMETSVPGVFAVGDGAGVAGALVAREEGCLAGIAAAEQAGALSAAQARQRRAAPRRRLRSLTRVRTVLDAVSRWRPGLAALAAPDTLVCRCEEVTRAEVEAALAAGARDLQAIKLQTRLGMGPCQGRNCAPSMTPFLCDRLPATPSAVGRITPRPPVRPVTLGALAGMNGGPEGEADGAGGPA